VSAFGIGKGQTVLDPFCGTGTTLVECKRLGVGSVGIERSPMAHLASSVKTHWDISPEALVAHAERVGKSALRALQRDGLEAEDASPLFSDRVAHRPRVELLGLPADQQKLLLARSISPLPLHRTLRLLGVMERMRDERFADHERVALARAMVFGIGNLHFGPEVGVGPAKDDAPAVSLWLANVREMAAHLRTLREGSAIPSRVILGDAREEVLRLAPESIDAVITSPPYPNEKDYTRTTRLESVLLGLIRSKDELRTVKKGLVRSNTRSVYRTDEDDLLVAHNAEVQRIARDIEERRIALGKTSGFERMYARVTKLYFGGMARHLRDLRPALRPGARLAYVVGDQASYLRVMIRTGEILAQVAAEHGYRVVSIDLFRTRRSTATGDQLREEVVVLEWPGERRKMTK
jgi:hypothetical protein